MEDAFSIASGEKKEGEESLDQNVLFISAFAKSIFVWAINLSLSQSECSTNDSMASA